jgi:alcohol dehydrogenase
VTAAWWLRQARALANPAGLTAGRIMLERETRMRGRRLRESALDAGRQRLRPTRRRMRALVLLPGGRLVWRSVPAPPAPPPLGAVVRPLAIATCDLDRPLALGATPFVPPLRFGHECVAEVLAVGRDVASLEVGQRVVVPFEISCGECEACRVGLTANCRTVPPISMYGFGLLGGHWGGVVADELAVPFADAMLVPLPYGIDPAAAASVADNVCDAYRHLGPYAATLLERDFGTRVVIVGGMSQRHLFTASVPLYAGLIAKALGFENPVVVDARASVRDQARELGLTALAPDRARNEPPAPLVADISGTPAGLRLALRLTSSDGVCSSSGSLHATTKIPTTLMFGRNITLTVARAHTRTLIPDVLDLMVRGRLRPELVTTMTASLDDAPAALTEHLRGTSTKTVVVASS